MTELSRHSDHWWLPDELLQIERGAIELHDAEIMTLARLYGVRPAPLPVGSAATLVIDRVPDDSDAVTAAEAPRPDAVAERLAVLAALLGLEAEMVMSWAPELAGVVGVATFTMRREIERSIDGSLAQPELTAALADRVVVPSTGVLIAEVSDAAVIISRRRDAGGAPAGIAAATLAALVHVDVTGAPPSL